MMIYVTLIIFSFNQSIQLNKINAKGEVKKYKKNRAKLKELCVNSSYRRLVPALN